MDAAAVDAICIHDADIVAISVSPDCSVVAVQHAAAVVCYSTAALVEQRKQEPLWTWHLPGGASVRQACHRQQQHVLMSDAVMFGMPPAVGPSFIALVAASQLSAFGFPQAQDVTCLPASSASVRAGWCA